MVAGAIRSARVGPIFMVDPGRDEQKLGEAPRALGISNAWLRPKLATRAADLA
jgi:hypothetical protein